MISVKEVLKLNEDYSIAYKALNAMAENLKTSNSDIDLEEVKSMSYDEIKILMKAISYRINDDVLSAIRKIKDRKKEELYPEILDAHYYPEIKEADWLSKEERLKIDNILANLRKYSEIAKLSDEVKEFLISKNILEKKYIVGCHHNSFDCDNRTFTEKEINTLKAYWQKEANKEETTAEEDEAAHYGCFEIYCDHENIEITNLEEFEDYFKEIRYSIIKRPDRTLDAV